MWPSGKVAFSYARRKRLRYLILGLLATMSTLLCMVLSPWPYVSLENNLFDRLATLNQPEGEAVHTLVVAVDDRSLAKYGQWSWSRDMIARLVDAIGAAGARAIVVDLLFSEADRTSPLSVRNAFLNSHGTLLDFGNISSDYLDHDQMLANALNRYPTVLGYLFLFGQADVFTRSTCLLHPLQSSSSYGSVLPFADATGALCNIQVLAQSARNSGFVNARHDADGVLRRLPALMRYGDNIYPSLDVAGIITGRNVQRIMFERSSDGLQLVLDELRIPLDENGNLIPRFRSAVGDFAPVSALSVLQGAVPAERFRGKIVLLGITATGLGDTHVTPVGRKATGLEIQATALENILSKQLLLQPAWGRGMEYALVILIGFLSTLLVFVSTASVCIAFFVVGSVSIWTLCEGLWAAGFWVSPLGACLVLSINLVVLNIIQRWREERRFRKKHLELVKSQDVTIMSLIALAETRDPDTGNHIKRTRGYIRILAEGLSKTSKYADILTPETINLLTKFAPLHDIGKVGIPDEILLKPGELTEAEFERIKEHTTLGYDALDRAEKDVYRGENHPYLSMARDIAYSHHERWDGTGYPLGLAGHDIPLGGRLMALADVYDALISQRIYKPAITHDQAVSLILEGRGSQFDPDVVDVFMELEPLFAEISFQYR